MQPMQTLLYNLLSSCLVTRSHSVTVLHLDLSASPKCSYKVDKI